MITFRLAPHSMRPGQNVVEVLIDGKVSATITADSFAAHELRVITRHLEAGPILSSETADQAQREGDSVCLSVIQIFLKRRD